MSEELTLLLTEAGATAEVVRLALDVIEARELSQQVIAQRVRRIREAQARGAAELAEKPSLTARAIRAFDETCQYCLRRGDATRGPDGCAWHLDRIRPGRHGGAYAPSNVTLACRPCNLRKGAAIIVNCEIRPLSIAEDEGCSQPPHPTSAPTAPPCPAAKGASA